MEEILILAEPNFLRFSKIKNDFFRKQVERIGEKEVGAS